MDEFLSRAWVFETLEVTMQQRSLAFALAGAAAVGGFVAGAGLARRPASAQTNPAASPASPQPPDLRGVSSAGTGQGGDAVIAYGNGMIAIVHPGSGAAPNGYIHTYRVTPTGQVVRLSGTGFDSDTGKTYGVR